MNLLDDVGGELFHTTKLEAWKKLHSPPKYRPLDDYFPSVIETVVGRLARQGIVKKEDTPEGTIIKLTEKGCEKVLLFKLDELKPKTEKWDGKWRMVFFDIEELNRRQRDKLRVYIKKIGLKAMQESVYISPYDIDDEVKYIREILNIQHSVKLGLLEQIENESELKGWFGL